MNRNLHPNLLALAIALTLTALAIAVLVTAYSYSRASGLFPIFIGWIFLLLSVLEVGVQLKPILRDQVQTPTAKDTTGIPVETKGVMSEAGGFLWLGLLLAVIYAIGFLLATPLFMFVFLRFAARRSVMQSAAIALAATVFVYVVFAWLLQYRLYPGVLFGG